MDTFKQAISVALVLAMLWSALSIDAVQVEASETEAITAHTPQSRVSDEKEIPDRSNGNKWLWIVLGALVVAGGVAALSGGDDGGGGSSDSTTEGAGSVGVTW